MRKGECHEGNCSAHDEGYDGLVGLDGVSVGKWPTDVTSSVDTDCHDK